LNISLGISASLVLTTVLQRLHLFLTDDYRLQRSAVECQTGDICSFRVLRVVNPIPPITIAASYAAKAFGIKTGTLAREARQLCPNVIPVQANHRLYTDYPERILATVDTCLPIEKIMPFDGMVCRLTSAER
jgi:nucleotidyltransferase/DNA polymerase involved in DNA repair